MDKEMRIPATYRNLMIYLDKCRVHVKSGNVVYDIAKDGNVFTYNIPYLNISILMLGPGVSITTDSLNKLADVNTTVISVTNNFRAHSITLSETSGENTKYFHKMIDNLYKENKRVDIAKNLLIRRDLFNREYFNIILEETISEGIGTEFPTFENLDRFNSIEQLLGVEGNYMKNVRKFSKDILKDYLPEYIQDDYLKKRDLQVRYEIGNSLIYGMSATVLHSLGIPYYLNIFHGRTNSGALKYDIADIIKSIVYITAQMSFINGVSWHSETPSEYVKILGGFLAEKKLLKRLFEDTIGGLYLS